MIMVVFPGVEYARMLFAKNLKDSSFAESFAE